MLLHAETCPKACNLEQAIAAAWGTDGKCLQVHFVELKGAHLGLYPVAQRVDVLWSGQPDRLHHFDSIRPQVLILQRRESQSRKHLGVPSSYDTIRRKEHY